MKRLIKAMSLLLVIALFAGMLVSCDDEPKKEGDILAVYNNTPVFQSEVQDIINYNLMTQYTSDTTEEEMLIIMGKAVGTYVQYKILELAFNENGIKVDEKAVNEQYKKEKANLEDTYEGGYKKWMQVYGVSDRFLKEQVRRYVLADMYYDQVVEDITVTEQEMKDYMNLHAQDYYYPAGYGWTMIFREVKDILNEEECAQAEAEAQTLINQILNGETTFDDAKNTLLEKYTAKDGYDKAQNYNGSDFTSSEYMPILKTEEDLNAILENHDSYYKDRDPSADPSSKEFVAYMSYLAECFEAETYYAIQNTEKGKVFSKPIKSVIGYGILRLDSVTMENSFAQFEDVKEELFAAVVQEKVQKQFRDYLNELHDTYSVEYLYTSF